MEQKLEAFKERWSKANRGREYKTPPPLSSAVPEDQINAAVCMAAADGDVTLFERLYREESYSYVYWVASLKHATNYEPLQDDTD